MGIRDPLGTCCSFLYFQVSVNSPDEAGSTRVHWAAHGGHIDHIILYFQVSVNSLDKAGSTPMHWAAHGGHIDCMKALLQVPNCNISVQVLSLHFVSWLYYAKCPKISNTLLHTSFA